MVVNVITPSTNYFTPTDTITKFYEEIRNYDVLSQTEEIELFKRYQSGDTSARDKIINCNQRFVVAVAKRFANNDNLPDLIDEGNIGLMLAIESFDIHRGVRFLTHAVWFIRREINTYLINTEKLVVPTNSPKTYHTVTTIKNEFLATHGRNPTPEEILEILEEKHDFVPKYKDDVYDVQISSINDTAVANHDSDDLEVGESSKFNERSASENDYNVEIDNEFNKHLIKALLDTLSERDRTIITLLYGIDQFREYEINEVADMMGMSSERIRQLKGEIINQLTDIYMDKIK